MFAEVHNAYQIKQSSESTDRTFETDYLSLISELDDQDGQMNISINSIFGDHLFSEVPPEMGMCLSAKKSLARPLIIPTPPNSEPQIKTTRKRQDEGCSKEIADIQDSGQFKNGLISEEDDLRRKKAVISARECRLRKNTALNELTKEISVLETRFGLVSEKIKKQGKTLPSTKKLEENQVKGNGLNSNGKSVGAGKKRSQRFTKARLASMTPAERTRFEEEKQEKNRMAARACRSRKKQRITFLKERRTILIALISQAEKMLRVRRTTSSITVLG